MDNLEIIDTYSGIDVLSDKKQINSEKKQSLAIWCLNNQSDYISNIKIHTEEKNESIDLEFVFLNNHFSGTISSNPFDFDHDVVGEISISIYFEFMDKFNIVLKEKHNIFEILTFLKNTLEKYNSINRNSDEEEDENDSDNQEYYYSDSDDDPYYEFNSNLDSKIDNINESLLKEIANKFYENDTDNELKNNALFSSQSVIQLIINEIKSINKSLENIKISPIDNNIFSLSVKLNNFDNDDLNKKLNQIKEKYNYEYIELKVDLNKYLYPHYPPDITFIKPRLINGLDVSILNLDYFKVENWNLTNSLTYTLQSLHSIINKYGDINIDSELNNPDGPSYLPIEKNLI